MLWPIAAHAGMIREQVPGNLVTRPVGLGTGWALGPVALPGRPQSLPLQFTPWPREPGGRPGSQLCDGLAIAGPSATLVSLAPCQGRPPGWKACHPRPHPLSHPQLVPGLAQVPPSCGFPGLGPDAAHPGPNCSSRVSPTGSVPQPGRALRTPEKWSHRCSVIAQNGAHKKCSNTRCREQRHPVWPQKGLVPEEDAR